MLAKSSSPVYLWYTRTPHSPDLCYHLRLESGDTSPVEEGVIESGAAEGTSSSTTTTAADVATDDNSVAACGAHDHAVGRSDGEAEGAASEGAFQPASVACQWHRFEIDLNHEKWLSVEQNVSDTVRANSPWSDDATREVVARRKSPLFLSVGIGRVCD